MAEEKKKVCGKQQLSEEELGKVQGALLDGSLPPQYKYTGSGKCQFYQTGTSRPCSKSYYNTVDCGGTSSGCVHFSSPNGNPDPSKYSLVL